MASRADHVHSHQFVLQRVVGALAMRDPDPASSPTRRVAGSLLASLLLAAVAVAAVGVHGLLRPGADTSWRGGNAVVIEQQTGARFVFRDGVLYPVLNFSSALLILGTAEPRRATVSRDLLAGIPRGLPLGIPGAPDLLPSAGELLTSPWTVCSRPASEPGAGAEAGSGASVVESVLTVGGPTPVADDLGDRALLAVAPAGGRFLVWHGRRFAVPGPTVLLAALGWSAQVPAVVSASLLAAIPKGADLVAPAVPAGHQASALDGFEVGVVVVVENQSGARQFGVVVADGLADITQVQADLLLGDPARDARGAAAASQPRHLSPAQYAAARHAKTLVPAGDGAPPATTPELVAVSGRGVCASFVDGVAAPSVGLVPAPARTTGELRVSDPGTAASAGLVEWVSIPPGRGVLVEAFAGTPAPGGALALVSDTGVRFPVPSAEVAGVLGYGEVRPVRLPAPLVTLIPAGRVLDPVAAAQPFV